MNGNPVESYTLAVAGIRVLDSNDSSVNYSVLLSQADWGNNHSSFPEETTTTSSSDPFSTTGPLLQLTGSIALGVLLSLFVVFALAGNLLVIVAITTDRHLRQSGNYFLVSLAIADMLVAVAVMTFAMVNDILGRWVFGPVLCDLWLSADVMCSTASILSLCSVSLDRYVHIRNPLHYERWVTARRALVSIAVVWALSAFISFLPIHLGWHRLQDEDRAPRTADQRGDGSDTTTSTAGAATHLFPRTLVAEPQPHCVLELNPLYAVLSSTISFYVPCIAMTVIYFRMHAYARRHAESIRRAYSNCPPALAKTPSSTLNTPTTGYYPREIGSTRSLRRASLSSRAHRMSDHKAAITLGIIMGVFLVCWVPFFTINVFGAFCRDCIPPLVFTVFTWLGYVNSTMNPVIYSIFNRQFREAFKRVLVSAPRCCCCCHLLNKSPTNGADYFQSHRRQRCAASGALYFSAAANEDESLANHNGTGTAFNANRNMQL